MAFSELEKRRIEKAVGDYVERRRPPPHIRAKLDLGYSLEGQSVELFEVRPVWNDPKRTIKHPVAKATYVKSEKYWKVYWLRANLKWYRYDPEPSVPTISEFLELVEADSNACFWG